MTVFQMSGLYHRIWLDRKSMSWLEDASLPWFTGCFLDSAAVWCGLMLWNLWPGFHLDDSWCTSQHKPQRWHKSKKSLKHSQTLRSPHNNTKQTPDMKILQRSFQFPHVFKWGCQQRCGIFCPRRFSMIKLFSQMLNPDSRQTNRSHTMEQSRQALTKTHETRKTHWTTGKGPNALHQTENMPNCLSFSPNQKKMRDFRFVWTGLQFFSFGQKRYEFDIRNGISTFFILRYSNMQMRILTLVCDQ